MNATINIGLDDLVTMAPTHIPPANGRHQLRNGDASLYAYLTAEDADRLSEFFCDLAVVLRTRDGDQ